MRASTSKTLYITSDFDNTLVIQNTALLLIGHYLFHGEHELFYKRIRRVVRLIGRNRRQQHLEEYYSMLQRIPKRTRDDVIRRATINPRWLRTVHDLRLEHASRDVRVTLLSRNSVDIVKSWLHAHAKDLAKNHIVIETIIANKPLFVRRNEYVRETGMFTHVDILGFGLMDGRGKKKFLDKHSTYIGDAEEESLRGVVKEFRMV